MSSVEVNTGNGISYRLSRTPTSLDSVCQVAASCNSATGTVPTDSHHPASFVTEMQAASAIRIEIETPWTRYWIGPPNGALRNTFTAAPGTKPNSMSREATLLAPEIAVTIAVAPGVKSANRKVFTGPPPAEKLRKATPAHKLLH